MSLLRLRSLEGIVMLRDTKSLKIQVDHRWKRYEIYDFLCPDVRLRDNYAE